jgi:hypothetical protein
MTMSDIPATRAEAFDRGATHYSTGKPCLRGHLAPRLTLSAACTECAKERHQRRVEHYHRVRQQQQVA